MTRSGRFTFLALAAAAGAAVANACGSDAAPSPFLFDPGIGGNYTAGNTGGGGTGGNFDPGPDKDATIGGPCTVDSQCFDGIDCTLDRCDKTIQHCRFTPDDSKCDNGAYCDGKEKCDNKKGCVPGEPKTCSDGQPCTIDSCDEATAMCKSEPLDADGDGDPDVHCKGGGDCDDNDPLVSSKQAEICGNGKDDNCNKLIDEQPCGKPKNDDCTDPLKMTGPGSYALTTVAAKLDYGSTCKLQNAAAARDVVASLSPAMKSDVQLTARTDFAEVTVTLLGQCGQPGSEVACGRAFYHPKGGRFAKLRARSVGPAQLAAYVATDQPVPVTLKYELLPPTVKPANETCGTAIPLPEATPTLASVVDAKQDLFSQCGPQTGELVYSFDLTEPRDIDLYASSVDEDGLPMISLRGAGCALPSDEITCSASFSAMGSAHIHRNALPIGTYYVSTAASAPTDILLTLQTAAPAPPPPDENCFGPPPALAFGKTIDVKMDGHQDDINTGCLSGAVDAAYSLTLAQPSDVLLVGRFSQDDLAYVELAKAPCKTFQDQLVCAPGYLSPSRARTHNLAAGNYRAVLESKKGEPMQLTAMVRPASPTVLVPFSFDCKAPQKISATGGFYQGNTANAGAKFDAGCDNGNQPPGGAPEQILELDLPAPKRVMFDMQGSGYSTILDVRQGPTCPGAELPKACAVGYYPDRSFLDLTLSKGTYWVQIDGFAGASGPWMLDVFVTDP